MRLAYIPLAAALAAPPLAHAQPADFHDALLDQMQGNWVMRGTADGGPTTHDLTVAWVLHHQYLELSEKSRERRPDGSPVYVANVYIGWDRSAQNYVCAWLDDYGGISDQSIGRAKPTSNRLDFVFNDPDGTRFHTSMIFDPPTTTWRWAMDQEAKGKLSPFARFALTRLKTKDAR